MITDDMINNKEQLDCKAIFASPEEIKNLEKVIDNMETVQRELLKVVEGLKAITE